MDNQKDSFTNPAQTTLPQKPSTSIKRGFSPGEICFLRTEEDWNLLEKTAISGMAGSVANEVFTTLQTNNFNNAFFMLLRTRGYSNARDCLGDELLALQLELHKIHKDAQVSELLEKEPSKPTELKANDEDLVLYGSGRNSSVLEFRFFDPVYMLNYRTSTHTKQTTLLEKDVDKANKKFPLLVLESVPAMNLLELIYGKELIENYEKNILELMEDEPRLLEEAKLAFSGDEIMTYPECKIDIERINNYRSIKEKVLYRVLTGKVMVTNLDYAKLAFTSHTAPTQTTQKTSITKRRQRGKKINSGKSNHLWQMIPPTIPAAEQTGTTCWIDGVFLKRQQ